MSQSTESLRSRNKRAARDAVLDAAERLLRSAGTADFSMRALAAEAHVGFVTPFNHFGSKTEIMRAISTRLIERMSVAFQARAIRGDLIDRTFAMADVAVEQMLEQPDVHRAVIGALGAPSSTPSAVMSQSRSLWVMALKGGSQRIAPDALPLVASRLDELLALAFRGCLSFWVAGEISDNELRLNVRRAFASVLLGFVRPECRGPLLSQL
ncbi:MAG TPA: TetR/AcrR family transcriptional regulator [Verrucomicrobiae bacterium]|nr:TetR/AcrR family transcriptional regulator [Verrucomicrobiae bacterium]